MVFVTCWLAFIAVTNVIGSFTKNLFNESDTTGKEEDLTISKKKRTRKRKSIEPHEYCGAYKIRRKEVHAQWIDNLSNCTEVKVLGEGSFGKVSLYCHNDTKMNFAVKQINAFDQESYEMERKILALGRSTRNHFLSALWGEFFDEDCFYLVLEYIFAGDLETIFKFHAKSFSEMQARFYISEVTCGLQYLHSLLVVHRDLKLANVLMDEDGHIKLADFGVAVDNMWPGEKIQDDSESGTPSYLAPEVIEHQPYDSCCDWWSLGVMLYYMLTSMMPFRKTVHKELYECICMDELEYRPKLSDMIAWSLVTQLLEKNPLRRIGYMYGSKPHIREHEFFQSLNWHQLGQRNIRPPWNPREAIFLDCEKKLLKQQAKSSPACESSCDSGDKTPCASISSSNLCVSAAAVIKDGDLSRSTSSTEKTLTP